MTELFRTTRNNITMHIRNIFKEKELDEKSVCKESLHTAADGKQSLRAILRTLIKIYTFAPNFKLGQNEYKRRRKVLCLNGSLVSSRVQEQEPSWIL